MKKIFLALVLLYSFTLVPVEEAQAQNCPLDWHPPPCGIPPKPVKDPQKEAARWRSNMHNMARGFFIMYTAGACGLERQGYKPAKLMCTAGIMGIGAADFAKGNEDRIVNDPYDPNFQELYTGRYLSYGELGMEFESTGDDYFDSLLAYFAEHTQTMEMLGDRIGVSIDRANSCVQAGIDRQWYQGCEVWQAEWVQANLGWYGERYQALAGITWDMADYLEQFEGQGVNPEFVDLLDEYAGTYNDAGWVFQQ